MAREKTSAGTAGKEAAAEKKPIGNKAEKVGEVVSTKMQKTIVVQVSRRVPHPLYKRIITKHKKFYVHDEENTARVGDVVRIVECRPLSKLKRWRLGDVIRRSALAGAAKPADLDKVV
jgi:small subunit ribosomal protein S17